MTRLLLAAIVAYLGCVADTQTQPAPDMSPDWPAAEVHAWRWFYGQPGQPPTTVYVGCCDAFDAWTRTVYVERSETPASSFLCRGYLLASFTRGHDPYLTIEDFRLDDPLLWGPLVDLCRYELEHI